MFSKILIANRGEIAMRIIRACKDLGIKTVAIHSTADSNSMHVMLADESVCIGPYSSLKSYLSMPTILSAIDVTGADAVHPGVGFLSENEAFAIMVREHGSTFIGPDPEHIRIMGDKIKARETMEKMNVPVIPGSIGSVDSVENAVKIATEIGYPVLIKARSGGGGRGMQVAKSKDEVQKAFNLAKSEAKAAFGDDSVYIERYLQNPRHIEIQVLADHFGNVIHLGERDCSIQRRHQKLWEEAPSPAINENLRTKIGDIVINACKSIGYKGVGTFEFLFENGEFFFMEMNTRIQVEHPITELVTGVDLVKEQIKVAAGMPLELSQKDIKIRGHAIECRINAEHPKTFTPSPGKIEKYHAPGGIGIRLDSHIYSGYTVPQYYDSLLAKLIAHGNTREECISRIKRAVQELVIEGIVSNTRIFNWLCEQEDIKSGKYDIHWFEKNIEKFE